MMVSKEITTALFIFAGISQVIALTFDKESPLRLPEGKTKNQEIARAMGSGRTFRITNSVPFIIDPHSGIITADKDFDFEDGDPNRYVISVSLSSGLIGADTGDITVIIENVNEAPICNKTFLEKRENETIKENYPMYTSIFTVPARDEDGDSLMVKFKFMDTLD